MIRDYTFWLFRRSLVTIIGLLFILCYIRYSSLHLMSRVIMRGTLYILDCLFLLLQDNLMFNNYVYVQNSLNI